MPGLGQQTGGDANSRLNEARKLLKIIEASPCANLDDWERAFLESQRTWVLEMGNAPSGKVIFKLRDLRDKVL